MEIAAATVLSLLLFLSTQAFTTATSPADESVAAHNQVRAEVSVPPLEWSADLATYALRYAEKQRDHHNCAMVHSRGQYGENLFWGSGKKYTLSDAVRSWAKEAKDYDADTNKCSPGKVCGHYTQVVWGDTKMVGCAAVECKDGATFIICSYDPPGNFVGERPFPRGAGKSSSASSGSKPVSKGSSKREEEIDAADASLCRCMLSCVNEAKGSQWRSVASSK